MATMSSVSGAAAAGPVRVVGARRVVSSSKAAGTTAGPLAGRGMLHAGARGAGGWGVGARRPGPASRTVMRAEEGEAVGKGEFVENVNSPVLNRQNPALAETVGVRKEGKAECTGCGFVYDESRGDPNYPVAAGTTYEELPEDWKCPICAAPKAEFLEKTLAVGGFQQNQGYGLGTNTMTGGEKNVLIYAMLALGFLFFMSGYFMQ